MQPKSGISLLLDDVRPELVVRPVRSLLEVVFDDLVGLVGHEAVDLKKKKNGDDDGFEIKNREMELENRELTLPINQSATLACCASSGTFSASHVAC